LHSTDSRQGSQDSGRLLAAMAEAGSSASELDAGATSQGDHQAAILMAAKAEVELMMSQLAAQSQAPAMFSSTLSDACRGQHLADVVKILVELGGIGPALSEMQPMQFTQQMQPMQQVQQMQQMQQMLAFNHMLPQFGFPYIQTGSRTPRSRQELSSANAVELELVGTTLVAKTSNDQAKLDVRAACGCLLRPMTIVFEWRCAFSS